MKALEVGVGLDTGKSAEYSSILVVRIPCITDPEAEENGSVSYGVRERCQGLSSSKFASAMVTRNGEPSVDPVHQPGLYESP